MCGLVEICDTSQDDRTAREATVRAKDEAEKKVMPTRDQAKNWHEPLFAVRTIASEDVMPAPRCYAIYRETRGDNWSITALYHIHQESSPLTPKQFATWQSVNGFGGQQALDLALLVIREVLGSDGNITACELERRRGSIDGPFRGDPSRIEYRGGADIPKLFVSAPGNTLRQAEPSSISVPSRRRRSRKHAQAFYGEDAALSAHFGTDIVIIERRSPSLAEEMIGLTAIIRARGLDETHNRQGIGCGVGWFGPMPFILIADFPRLRQTAELTMATETAINTTLRDRDLVRPESRVDVDGPCVIACDRDRRNLFAIRHLRRHA